MPFQPNDDTLDQLLDMPDHDRSIIVFAIASKERRVIEHISQADVRNGENPSEKLTAQIQSGYLPEYLSDGTTQTFAEFESLYKKAVEFTLKDRINSDTGPSFRLTFTFSFCSIHFRISRLPSCAAQCRRYSTGGIRPHASAEFRYVRHSSALVTSVSTTIHACSTMQHAITASRDPYSAALIAHEIIFSISVPTPNPDPLHAKRKVAAFASPFEAAASQA